MARRRVDGGDRLAAEAEHRARDGLDVAGRVERRDELDAPSAPRRSCSVQSCWWPGVPETSMPQ